MKIKKITLKNYKFHHQLSFDINQDNSLIYGENGTGKSSIYKALYSNFYYLKDNKIVTNQIDIKEKFIHREFSTENLEVNIELNNNYLNRENNILTNAELLENQTIYFADEKVFQKITQYDFYQVINSELIKHFPLLKELDSIYRTIRTSVNRSSIDEQEDLVIERQEADRLFREKFQEQVPLAEVKIILKKLDEKFEIIFEVKDSDIQFDTKKFISPQIAIKVKDIDDKGDFKNHFNEAKLKLISIAIYFALAKKYEMDSDLKLLVLDDFLTSLDMANRKLIIQYILENFGEYQKIILTHNIQFYNLIVKLLKMRDEDNTWDIKNIFIDGFQDTEVAKIINKDTNYLEEAEKYLKAPLYDLGVSGNFIRKEFERILTQYEQLLELGRVEDLDQIIKALKNLDYIFVDAPSKILYENFPIQLTKINRILSNSRQPDSQKIEQLKVEIEVFTHYIDNKKKAYDTKPLRDTIHKTDFYKNILMNSSSHNDTDKELYRKEFKQSIEILKKLKKILGELK